jgi:hypothetical protein
MISALRRSGGAGEIRRRDSGTPLTAFPVPTVSTARSSTRILMPIGVVTHLAGTPFPLTCGALSVLQDVDCMTPGSVTTPGVDASL